MAQRRFHCEQAFEHYLRSNRMPYVAVDEARRALGPIQSPSAHTQQIPGRFDKAVDSGSDSSGSNCSRGNYSGGNYARGNYSGGNYSGGLKSFDFVVYGGCRNLLIDIKGRRQSDSAGVGRSLQTWVTEEDVQSLQHWQTLFGDEFEAVFVFAYWRRVQPADGLYETLFHYNQRWYALYEVSLKDYADAMTTRSPKWRTVSIPAQTFTTISQPFNPRNPRNP